MPEGMLKAEEEFLLTHPVWDVTLYREHRKFIHNISTHTSRVGCDLRKMPGQKEVAISTHTSRVGCD